VVTAVRRLRRRNSLGRAAGVWLRVSRIDHAFAYHASLAEDLADDRFFPSTARPLWRDRSRRRSPTGDGCVVTFDDIRFTRKRLGDLRDGS